MSLDLLALSTSGGSENVVRACKVARDRGVFVAGLTGDDWLSFLDGRWGRDEFSAGIGRVLIYGPYAPENRVSADDVNALNTLCLDWVRAQRPAEQ